MKILILFVVTLIFVGCSSTTTDETLTTTTIVVIRHAEKLGGSDPGLSPAGQQRAANLVTKLSSYDLGGVYTSNYKRTIETATPSAESFNLEINSSISPVNYDLLRADILENHIGKTVLVVGHSNTVPGFINHLFPFEKPEVISENDFSNFYELKVKGGVGVEFIKEKY